MKDSIKDFLILRLSKTYSRNPEDGGMFVEIFLKLKGGEQVKAASNQIFSPTDVRTVCDGICKAVRMNLRNVYHLAGEEIMSRYDFALRVADEYGFRNDLIESVDLNTLSLLEKRPLNTSLNVEKFKVALSADNGCGRRGDDENPDRAVS